MSRTIQIGTRDSRLALYQANKVRELLEEQFPDYFFQTEIIKTKGDKILDVALSKIGDKGLFTKDIELAILDGRANIGVHSLKDLPTVFPEGLCVGGVLQRGEVRDALVTYSGKKLSELNADDIIATSSLRRKAQLLKYNPEFNIVDIRGNVNTRLKKMEEGYCTAMIMAATGLQRLGLEKHISEILDVDVMIPAVSQGAIAIEIRENDTFISELISKINHAPTLAAVTAERIFLNKLEGGCQIPIGAYSKVDSDVFSITGFMSPLDGTNALVETMSGPLNAANKIAGDLADSFIRKGAREILNAIRDNMNS